MAHPGLRDSFVRTMGKLGRARGNEFRLPHLAGSVGKNRTYGKACACSPPYLEKFPFVMDYSLTPSARPGTFEPLSAREAPDSPSWGTQTTDGEVCPPLRGS